MKYSRPTLSKMLQCCERTIHRATMNGDLFPCQAVPVIYDEKDVLSFINSNKKGSAMMLKSMPIDFVDTAKLAEAVAVSAGTIRRWVRDCAENKIPHYRLSQTWILLSVSEITAWMQKQARLTEKRLREKQVSIEAARISYETMLKAKRRKK